MDPALRELLEGDPEEEVPVIVRLRDPEEPPPDVRIVARLGPIATCRVTRDTIVGLRAHEAVVSVKAPRDVVAEPQPPPVPTSGEAWADVRRPRNEFATGQGIVVGVVDWGFDFAHPDFRRPDGGTRLLALWDQRGGNGPPADPYGYGVVHTREAIDQALGTEDPYAALRYNPADADAGRGSHGTHVAGIVAGNGRGGGPSGLAPEADLVCVDMTSAGMKNLGDSVTLLEAVHFIADQARGRPWVINLSMGNHGGPHDGLTLVEMGLDAAVSEGPGRVICQSAGNYYARSVHSAGVLRPGGRRRLLWQTDEADITPNEMEVWYPGVDVLSVEVRSPGGRLSGSVMLTERGAITIDGREVCKIHHRAHDPNNSKNHIDIFLYPGAPAGVWEVVLTAVDVSDGRYHCWIERDGACPRCQSFLDPEIAVGSSTTGTICNGLRTIAVGAYDAHSPQPILADFSSSGPTADGRQKPDLVAPGVRVLSARSTPRGGEPDTPLYTRMSGTSMAAPHVAGTVALMLEAAPRPLWVREVRALLLRATRPAGGTEHDRWGDGILDTASAVQAARNLPQDWVAGRAPPALRVRSRVGGADPGRSRRSGRLADARWSREGGVNVKESADGRSPLDVAEEMLSLVQRPLPSETLLRQLLPQDLLREISHSGNGRVTPCRLFSLVSAGGSGLGLEQLEVVASPGSRIERPLTPGDVILTCPLGEPAPGHAAVVASADLYSHEQISAARLVTADREPGRYVHVVEGSPIPHSLADAIARRVADSTGRLSLNRMIIRLRTDFAGGSVRGSDHGGAQSTDSTTVDALLAVDDHLSLQPWRGFQEGETRVADRPTLRQGARGAAVGELQLRLRAIPGLAVQVDGIFGAETRSALVRFQEAHRLSADGVAGRRTWETLVPLSGGPPLDDAQQARIREIHGRALKQFKNGDFAGSLKVMKALYSDPIMVDKPELRAQVAWIIGGDHHHLREFRAALEWYTESIISSPFALELNDLLPVGLERIREARLELPPTKIALLRDRRMKIVTPNILLGVREGEAENSNSHAAADLEETPVAPAAEVGEEVGQPETFDGESPLTEVWAETGDRGIYDGLVGVGP